MDKRLSDRQFFHWCKQLFWISLFGLCVVISLETVSSATKPVVTKKNLHPIKATQKLQTVSSATKSMAKLENWRFSPEALQLEITLSAASQPHYFYLAQPPRIVVDLPNTKLGYVSTKQNYSGAIQSIRVSRLKTGVTRIVMDLAPGTFVDPKKLKLQPVSSRNPTRWILRPLIANARRSFPLGSLPLKPSYLSPTTSAPQLTNNQPLSVGNDNSPQPPNNQPLSVGNDNSPQPPAFTIPPPLTNLPPTNSNNQQVPWISVPPLSPNNPSQTSSSLLPPANFPNQPANPNSVPPSSNPNFPVPTVPNYPPSSSNSNVINFGQPFPNSIR
ncbi:MAG: AMIN domain-containing protein [Stigonema ocellatum SAG 48.90 = DSM 106950]|nr:AMIN domain-containing protein [Stigonema ocellatum SAG 48.90 = DSM 106950]